jgi:hypothetical protein
MQLSKVTQTAIFTFVVSLSLFVNHSESFAQKNKHNTPASVEQFPIPADGQIAFFIFSVAPISTLSSMTLMYCLTIN